VEDEECYYVGDWSGSEAVGVGVEEAGQAVEDAVDSGAGGCFGGLETSRN